MPSEQTAPWLNAPFAYSFAKLTIETDDFMQFAAELLDDENLRIVQNLLLEKPDHAQVIASHAKC